MALNTVVTEILTNADYPEDLLEETVVFLADSNMAVVPQPTTRPIRSIEWLQVRGLNLKQTTPREISKMACPPINVFYRSGNNLILNTSYDSFQEFRIGYYPAPQLLREDAESDAHWLLQKYPAVLLSGTIARTFKATGDDDSAAYYEREYVMLRTQIRRSSLED